MIANLIGCREELPGCSYKLIGSLYDGAGLRVATSPPFFVVGQLQTGKSLTAREASDRKTAMMFVHLHEGY